MNLCAGAHYIHGGVDAAQAMMGWLGCEVGVDPSVREEARTRRHGQLELLPDSKVDELEALLKYRFQNRGLLVEALTHASCPRRSGYCYQVGYLLVQDLHYQCVVRFEPSTAGWRFTRSIDNGLCICRDWNF